MKSCQLCGAASWGPADNSKGAFLCVGSNKHLVTVGDLVKCDECGLLAERARVQDPPTSTWLGSGAVWTATRLERLTCAILSSQSLFIRPSLTETAQKIVDLARALEVELDAPADAP